MSVLGFHLASISRLETVESAITSIFQVFSDRRLCPQGQKCSHGRVGERVGVVSSQTRVVVVISGSVLTDCL